MNVHIFFKKKHRYFRLTETFLGLRRAKCLGKKILPQNDKMANRSKKNGTKAFRAFNEQRALASALRDTRTVAARPGTSARLAAAKSRTEVVAGGQQKRIKLSLHLKKKGIKHENRIFRETVMVDIYIKPSKLHVSLKHRNWRKAESTTLERSPERWVGRPGRR